MVKVVDAIMGSGKTSAAITYINEHPEKRFLYITPYITEDERIRDSCPNARFFTPVKFRNGRYITKTNDILNLLKERRNIASTHKLVEFYTPEVLEALRNGGYCIIIDETVSVMDKDINICEDDIRMAVDGGYIYEDSPNVFKLTGKEYSGMTHRLAFRMLQSRTLVQLRDRKRATWYWTLSRDLFEVSDDVFLMTYLFKGSEMQHFLDIHGIEYTCIGIAKSEDGTHRFAPHTDYIPSYVYRLKDMIHIWDNPKHNAIGDDKNSLSMNWFRRSQNADKVERLRKNIQNFFRNIHSDVPASKRMCGTFNEYWGKIRSAGYASEKLNKVPFNQRAKNDWSDHTVLVYPVNIIPNPAQAEYYSRFGKTFNADLYALSIMLQWIWRSAIRNGEEIWIYIPSKRMRNLLSDWIEKTSKGGSYY